MVGLISLFKLDASKSHECFLHLHLKIPNNEFNNMTNNKECKNNNAYNTNTSLVKCFIRT